MMGGREDPEWEWDLAVVEWEWDSFSDGTDWDPEVESAGVPSSLELAVWFMLTDRLVSLEQDLACQNRASLFKTLPSLGE